MDNIERLRQVRYELFTAPLGNMILDQEPKGSSNDVRSFKRDKKSKGILIKTVINLVFYGDGAEWLSSVYRSFGISKKVLLRKYTKDDLSINERWVLSYVQEIDIATWDEDSKTLAVTVEATEGGLFDDIKGRQSNKYDVINNESADGIDIGDLKTYNFTPQPRGILRESVLKMKNPDTSYRVNSARQKTGTSGNNRTVPLEIITNRDSENIVRPWASQSENNEKEHNDILDVGNYFFFQAESKTTIKVKAKLEFEISKVTVKHTENEIFFVRFWKLSPEGTGVTDTVLLSIQDHRNHINERYMIDVEQEFVLEKDESLGLMFNSVVEHDSGIFEGEGYLDTFINVIKSEVTVTDETEYRVTTNKCIKPFDLFERLIAKITGVNGIFRSSIFEKGGEYEHFVVDNGLMTRGFPESITGNEDEEDVIYTKLNTSFSDAFESFSYLEPLSWFVEIEGDQQIVRIEKATYTMNNFIGLDLGEVSKIKHESSPNDFFSLIKIGHNGSLEYEDASGLEEYCGVSEFSTHITRKSEYSVISKYRFDAIPYELTRRKYHEEFPKEDTKFDNDIWIHDTKQLSNGDYIHNLWQDYFDVAPTGIFDPETAWNLRMSPLNRLFEGHGYSVKRGLYHFPENSIRFTSSNSNSNMTTVKDGFSLKEGGSLKIKNIDTSSIEPEKTNFTFKMTDEIGKKLLSSTKVDGLDIKNYFGLIKYKEKGEPRYGRMLSLEGSEEAKIKLINARL